MTLVSGNDESQSADGDRIVVGDAAPRQLLFVEVSEEMDRRRTNRSKFVDQIGDRSLVEPAGRHVRIFIEARQWLRIAAGEAERPMSENSLGVAQMANDFLDGPLASGVRVQTAGVIYAAEQADRIAILLGEQLDEIAVGDERDVALVVREVLVRRGARRESRRHGLMGGRLRRS